MKPRRTPNPDAEPASLFERAPLAPSSAPPALRLRIKPRPGGQLADAFIAREKFGPLSPADLTELALTDGSPCTDDTRSRLLQAVRRRACLRKAVTLLAARPRSERELHDRLLAAGFEPPTCSDAINSLRAQGLLNDNALAESIIERAARHGDARPSLEHQLRRRGINPDSNPGADSSPDPDDESAALTIARSILSKRAPSSRPSDPTKEQRRLYSALLRRGFSQDAAERAASCAIDARPGSHST